MAAVKSVGQLQATAAEGVRLRYVLKIAGKG